MARPRASEQRDTRRDVVDSALELFADKGFYGTSVRDIARAVGVRESAIYHYFANKEAIFEAVMFMPDPDVDEDLALPPLPTHAVDVQPWLERLVVQLIERFLTLKERKRFRILMADGARLAMAGQFNFWDRMAPRRQKFVDALMLLQEAQFVRLAEPQMLAVAFMSPILMLRHIAAVSPDHAFVQNYKHFAKLHVEQFLRGAESSVRLTAATN